MASSLMTRCNAFNLSFRDPDHRFNEDRVKEQRPGFLVALRARLSERFATPADALQPYIELLDDD
eukprot:13261613-Alexandrium_andersonii.AAC.1